MITLSRRLVAAMIGTSFLAFATTIHAVEYPAPQPSRPVRRPTTASSRATEKSTVPICRLGQSSIDHIAIRGRIKAEAKANNVEVFMLAPQSGADSNSQMGMIQDAITHNVNAIILSTHDEAAAAPLVKQAVDKGIAVVIVNSDIAFPDAGPCRCRLLPAQGHAEDWPIPARQPWRQAREGRGDRGQPGYHSTERVGGFPMPSRVSQACRSSRRCRAAGTWRAATRREWTCCRPIQT